MSLKLHHVGIAVPESEAGHTLYDKEQDVSLRMTMLGNLWVELVAGEKVNRFIGKGIYHVCFESTTFEDDCKYLKNNGYVMVSSPKPAILFDGKLVAFFKHEYYGLVEVKEV